VQVFGDYSRYYNLFYRDKNYSAEVNYVVGLIEQYCFGVRTLLDLGCGTGRHASLLAKHGYSVAGVDRSEEMLDLALRQLATISAEDAGRDIRSALSFHLGDIRTIRLRRTYDVVLSLFHVISYQAANDDLLKVFATVREHLEPGGLFIFDCWYGPAVLTDRPAVRVKRLEDDDIAVTRIAEPVLHPNTNLVDVNYQVLVRDKANGLVEELRESHTMRYLFRPEIELLLAEVGMYLVAAEEWLTGRPLGFDTWGGCFVAKRR